MGTGRTVSVPVGLFPQPLLPQGTCPSPVRLPAPRGAIRGVMDLFANTEAAAGAMPAETTAAAPRVPLAWRMRPRTLDEYTGQPHLLGPGGLLRRQLAARRIGSLILYGPPGCGKTALAHLIARTLQMPFTELNAVTAGVPEIRKAVETATRHRQHGGGATLLFIDEIHRFNKPQQSALLPHVEQGLLTLIGASTQNPFFSIIPPLASRSHIVELKPHGADDLGVILEAALGDSERGLGSLPLAAEADALAFLAERCEGDARRALNTLEMAALTTPPDASGQIRLTRAVLEQCLGKKAVVYDGEDAHYDTASAFIKSIRGSDADAALYWLAKMIEGGEDPLFIARRLVISASEDIGNADPRGLMVAVAAQQAVSAIGMPEGRIPLAQATTYLALAPKSNAAYLAVDAALADIRGGMVLPVPPHLQDAHYPGAKRLGRGDGYLYPHDFPGHFVSQDYLGARRSYYRPTGQGFEARLAERMADLHRLGQTPVSRTKHPVQNGSDKRSPDKHSPDKHSPDRGRPEIS